jgi:hypothetical protein
MRSVLIFICFVLANTLPAAAQIFSFSPTADLSFLAGNDTLRLALAGGINSGQINKIDLNGDQVEDLVVFEKTSGKLLCFRTISGALGSRYVFEPTWEYYFPRINNWLLLRDYDCDGYKDIFTNMPLGVQVYKQIPLPNGQPSFLLVANPLLSTTFAGNPVNLQVAATDIPIIEDLDGDGDLELVCLQFGGTTLEYHKNISIENGGACGLNMSKIAGCWGGLATTNVCGDFLYGLVCREGESIDTLQPDRVQHFGASLLALDMDGDGDKDLLLSDVGCEQLYYATNAGTPSAAAFANVSFQFPPGPVPAWMRFFPTAYLEDVDGDQLKDLLVCPSSFGNDVDGNEINFRQSVWYYKNTGTTTVPQFSFQRNDFLQNQMIDVGEEAIPVVVDVDGDGLKDLLIGGRGNRFPNGEFYAGIQYYRHVGTPQQPVFRLTNPDFGGFSSLRWSRLRPVVADLNGDNALDLLLLGSPNISQGSTSSRVFINNAAAGQAVNWSGTGESFPIAFTVYDCPLFTDIDGDNIQDMLLGKYAGRMQYYRNTGSNQNPVYTLANNGVLGFPRNSFARNINMTIGDFDMNGLDDLAVSDSEGEMRIFKDFKAAVTAGTPAGFIDTLFVKLPFQSNQTGTRYRVFSSPEAFDLDGNGTPDLLIGLTGGGIVALKNNALPTASQSKFQHNDFNIAFSERGIEMRSDSHAKAILADASGRTISEWTLLAGEVSQKAFEHLRPGMYILYVQSGQGVAQSRWLKTR